MPRRYKAILFDLCGTVMPYHTDHIQIATINGKTIRTTTPMLYAIFQEYNSVIPYEQFHHSFIKATERVNALRESDGREVSSDTRFQLFFELLGMKDQKYHAILKRLQATHLDRISGCLVFPASHRDSLVTLKRQYKMGLVTNFDDTDTVYKVLKREGIDYLFETVIISAEVGLRKPRGEIFHEACERLSIVPTEALFIGDSWESDVGGAKGVGMDAAWINMDGLPIPDHGPSPDYMLADLTQIQKVLIS